MKKRVLFFACLSLLFSLGAKAQTSPFRVEWQTYGSSNSGGNEYRVLKTVTGSAIGSGIEDARGLTNTLGTLSLYEYSNATNATSVTDLVPSATTPPGQGWGRYRATSTTPNFAVGAIDATQYAQYEVEPNGGQFMRINNLSIVALGGGTGDLRMVIKYAKVKKVNAPLAADFVKMPQVANYYLTGASGAATTYAAEDETSAILLLHSNGSTSGTRTQEFRTITFTNLGINVEDDEKVYIRLYPFLVTGTSATSTRYLFLRHSVVSGVTSATTLPLDLISFSAKPDALGKSVNLNWKTTNEVNTQDFVVERRTDDTEFALVGTVLSKNVAGTHNYIFVDKKPVSGNSYYRLKQRDRNGKFTYSDIANVKIDGIALSLYPNPVSKELVVNHEYAKQSASLKVIGLDGKTHIKTSSITGSSSTIINVAPLAPGTYLLVHDVNGKAQSQKFIKK